MSYGTAGQVLVSAGAGLAPVWTTFDSTPVGTTIWRPYSSTPSGYIPAEGGTYSRASYPALHALAKADGYPHGDGDGITTFNVIDMRGRFPLGYGTGTATDATPHNLGDESGTETVALVEANNAPHTHTLEATVGTDVDDNALSGPPYYLVMRSESPEATVGAITGVTAASGGGAGTAHANMPPFAVGRWFIKAA
jgi:microcystin-dependent protein